MNAYEIRTKILKMAKEMVQDQYWATKDRWSESMAKDDEGKIIDMKGCPTPPTLKDVMDAAETMYSFVKSQS